MNSLREDAASSNVVRAEDRGIELAPYRYWLSSMRSRGLSNRKKREFLAIFGTSEEIFHATEREIREKGPLRHEEILAFLHAREQWHLEEEYERFCQREIALVTLDDICYPAALAALPDPPYGLFYLGKLPEGLASGERRVAAVVGTRDPSGYGIWAARELGSLLAQGSYLLVSGMARGIDGIAQRACLDAGGESLAFLGSGVDVCYPRENRDLYQRLIEKGCVMSEYPPGTAPLAQHFPARNRLISGISSALLLIEARKKSGSLITADLALEQGKDIYALPGRLGDPMSEGCNQLLHQGAAQIISSLEDLMEDMKIAQRMGRFSLPEPVPASGELENEELLLYHCLDFYPTDLDRLVEMSTLGYWKTVQALTTLCDKGLAIHCAHQHFRKLR